MTIRIIKVERGGRSGLLVRAYGGPEMYFLAMPEEVDRRRVWKLARALCEASPLEFSDLIVEHLDRGLSREHFRMTRPMVGVLLASFTPSSTRAA